MFTVLPKVARRGIVIVACICLRSCRESDLTVTQTNLTSSNLTIDHTDPTLSNLTIYSNNHNTSPCNLGQHSKHARLPNASVIVNENHTDGQVKFNITAFDLAGNNLTVNQTNLNSSNLTIDKNVPSVTNLSLYSNNSDPSLARAGDLINITLEVSEQIYNATLQIFDTETSMTESNNTAYANITVLQNSTNGPVEFNITAYDETGNVFNVTSENITENNVVIDTINPSLANLTIYSNNANTSLATVNNILNITITANETLKAANITILDSTYVMNVSGVVANASVTVSQDSDEGEVSFNITAFDLAGNSFATNQTQLNSSNVIIDHSIPGVEDLNVASNNSNPKVAMAGDAITVTLQVSEQIGNSTLQILNNDIVMTINDDTASATITVLENSTNGPVEFNITAYDKTGNVFNVTQDDITGNNVVV